MRFTQQFQIRESLESPRLEESVNNSLETGLVCDLDRVIHHDPAR